jgi:RNA polymerase sigma-70 factor (ECF subfamily)
MERELGKWVSRLRRGDQSAFLPLYEKTAPGFLRFLLWKTRGDRATSEDILQETYVRFLLHLDNLHSHEDLAVRSYLFRTLKNCFIDKVKRKGATQVVPLDEIPALEDRTACMHQEQAVEMRELMVAMESLEERECEIVWLRDALGFSHKEVAQQVGISEQAARQAYVRAKRALFSAFHFNPEPAHAMS